MVKAKASQGRLENGAGSKKPGGNGQILILAVLDMSWRMAIVVLVPVIGGFELDKHLGITPALTITGFLIAMVGVFVILKQAVAGADSKFSSGRTK